MNCSRSNHAFLSKRSSISLVWTASLIVLTACGAASPPNTSTPDPINSGIGTTGSIGSSGVESTDNTNGASGADNTDNTNGASPVLGPASPVETDALAPDDVVACDAPTEHIQQRTLELINLARSQPRMCGNQSFEATTALSWNSKLLQAADKHSIDMTEHNFFDHTGSDGSSVATRVDETGYDWRAVGENIAAGQTSAAQVVAGWLDSVGHCKNMMNPAYTEVAVTCVVDNGADFTRYWTNVLAAPR